MPSPDTSFIARRVGANLRRIRTEAKFSRDELSARSSVSQTGIADLERGARAPELVTLLKLAAGLGVKSEDLLDGIEWEITGIRRGRWTLRPPD